MMYNLAGSGGGTYNAPSKNKPVREIFCWSFRLRRQIMGRGSVRIMKSMRRFVTPFHL